MWRTVAVLSLFFTAASTTGLLGGVKEHFAQDLADGYPLLLDDEYLDIILGDDECSMDDIYPENDDDALLPHDDVCYRDTLGNLFKPKPKPHPQCRMCCKAGAVAGKKVKQHGKQAFKQCAVLYKRFFEAHKKCIKKPRRCGLVFVLCCTRRHHKQIYQQTDNQLYNRIYL